MTLRRSGAACALGCALGVLQPLPAGAQAVTYANGVLENGIVSVAVEVQDGSFSIRDAQSREVLLADGRFRLPAGFPAAGISILAAEDVADALGTGKRVVLEVTDWNLWRYSDHHASGSRPPRHLVSYTLYEDRPALVIGFGLKTPEYMSMRLMKSQPLAGGRLFGGKPIEKLKTLNGSAGAETTLVKSDDARISANSLMLTGLVDGQRRSAVWGGLRYKEFAAVALLDRGAIGLYAEDPVGRLVDEGETYVAGDTFYLDVHTREPFEALERYGSALRAANQAQPNVYDFPITCGWSVGHISKLPNINTSAKLIGELGHANRCGMTRYTDVALRLEPDKYHGDTEQGWWDDEHMRRFGHLEAPYDTVAKWSEAMRAGHGIPYIYMQLGMPSDDFARQFPQFMLFNDASEVDRQTPGTKPGKPKHPHHQPYVTYDYTDPGFSKHVVEAWRKLHEDGIRGVKVDYPETAWRPEGGFEDRHASCAAAYRRAFQLLREAMGKDGLIDERNLGESGRPCLDITAGIIDTQRIWGDSNEFVPEMISRSGLRWYKNRTVFNYYSDTKAVHDHPPTVVQSLLTMNFLVSGRLDLSSSYSLFTPEITRMVSRTYPHYREARTARPLDAFTGVTDPQVYDLELTPDWHQVVLYNTAKDKASVSTSLSGERVDNALGLDPRESYHAHEFWSDTYLGRLPGTARVERALEPNCCAMISVRKALPHPQVISTDRHLLQGWVDLADVKWDPAAKTLRGKARVIGGEPFKIVVAGNGHTARTARAEGAVAELTPHPAAGLSCLTLSTAATAEIAWAVAFE
jgi:hypothetical protein